MDKETCLDTAKEIITKDRQNSYGKPEDNFSQISVYWENYLTSKGYDVCIVPNDVAVMMTLLKIARTTSSPQKADNYVDACGYMAIASELTNSK